MEPQEDAPTLNDEDALSLWVGRVARQHARLEYNVDNVHRFLAHLAGEATDSNSFKGFDQLVGECRTLLDKSHADAALTTPGHVALRAARKATAERNRVVHDMWLPDPLLQDWEPPRWNTFRRSGELQQSYASATSQDLRMVSQVHANLARTCIRVSGLFMALHATWPQGRTPTRPPAAGGDISRYVALMTDQFTLHANGDFELN